MWRQHRSIRLLLSVALVLASSLALTVTGTLIKGGVASATTPGTPGTPQAGTPVYTEDFENAITNNANGAESYSNPASTTYVGASGETYTGSPSWIDGTRCNGVILSNDNTTVPPWALSGAPGTAPYLCSEDQGVKSYEFLRMLARAMGQQFTPSSPDTDHVVSSYTECQYRSDGSPNCDILPSGATNGIMYKTVQPITTIPGHYYVFGVDTAYMNCGTASADPSYQFALISSGTTSAIGSPLDGCQTTTDPNVAAHTQTVTANVGGVFGTVTKTVHIDSMTTNQAFRATTSSVGIEMYNNNGTTNGNDGAFDNVRLIDVTPQLDKSFSPPSIPQGGTSALRFTITNTSELDAKTGWSFTDNLPSGLTVANPTGATTTCPNGVVSATAGGSTITANGDLSKGMASCTVTVNVTATAVGTYTNTGCVDSTGATIPGCNPNVPTPDGLNPPGKTTLTVTPVVDMAITKTASAADYVAGGPITYTVKVTNSGPSDAVGATVTDSLPSSITNATWTCVASAGASCTASGSGNINDTVNVPVGGSVTYTVVGTVAAGTTGSLSNTATVVPPTGTTDPKCPPAPSTGCSSTVTLPTDAITVVKTPSSTVVSAAGQVVNYSFLVTNTGQTTLTNVAVNDVQIAPASQANLSAISCPATTLAVGASETCTATYTVTAADIANGHIKDTATATGTPPSGTQVTSPPSPATVDVAGLTIVKTADKQSVSAVGDVINYSFLVTNTGTVPLTGVSVTDTQIAPALALTSGPTCPSTTLAVGASETCTATYTVTQADLDNGSVNDSAISTGTPPTGPPVDSPPSTVTVPVTSGPAITVLKAADRQTVSQVGDVITYSFLVTNTGQTTLSDVTVTDTQTAPAGPLTSGPTCPSSTLAIGASEVCTATYTVTQADLDNGTVGDIATAQGTPPGGPPIDTPPSPVTVPVTSGSALTIVKTADVTLLTAAGQVVTYKFVVTNTGALTLHDITVDDMDFSGTGTLSPVQCPATASLAPGASITCTATYTVTAADIASGQLRNTAVADGTVPGGGVTHSPPSTVSVPTGGVLASTGVNSEEMLIIASLLVLLGVGLIFTGSRRSTKRR